MSKKKKHWLENKKNVKSLWNGFLTTLVIVAGLDLFVHHHEHFGVDGTKGFYSWYGFLSCLLMIAVAKGLALVIKRKDTYYDDK